MDLVGGAVDPRGGYVSKMHVKTKESGPVGGGARPLPLDPPMCRKHYSNASDMLVGANMMVGCYVISFNSMQCLPWLPQSLLPPPPLAN